MLQTFWILHLVFVSTAGVPLFTITYSKTRFPTEAVCMAISSQIVDYAQSQIIPGQGTLHPFCMEVKEEPKGEAI